MKCELEESWKDYKKERKKDRRWMYVSNVALGLMCGCMGMLGMRAAVKGFWVLCFIDMCIFVFDILSLVRSLHYLYEEKQRFRELALKHETLMNILE